MHTLLPNCCANSPGAHGRTWQVMQFCRSSRASLSQVPRGMAASVYADRWGDAVLSGRVIVTDSWVADAIFYLANNHVLLSVVFAHPSHPYSRCRRLLVLLNSLSFAFFVTAVLHALIPFDPAVAVLELTVGTVLQILFDVPASLLGTCPCARSQALPPSVRLCCQCVSMSCLSCHFCASVLFALLGAVLLAVSAAATFSEVQEQFVSTKVASFVGAVPTTILIYAVLREWERCTSPPQRESRSGLL